MIEKLVIEYLGITKNACALFGSRPLSLICNSLYIDRFSNEQPKTKYLPIILSFENTSFYFRTSHANTPKLTVSYNKFLALLNS